MNIYATVIVLLLLLFLIEQMVKDDKIRQINFYIGSFICLFILALRSDNVGGDTIGYCGYFTGVGGFYSTYERNDELEIGFRWICGLLMKISRTELWFLVSTSIMTMAPFLYLVNRDCKPSKILPLILYMSGWSILSVTQTAIRQNIAISFLMIAYIVYTEPNINKKYKWILCIASIVMCLITHNTGITALVLVLGAYFIKLNKKSSYIIVIASLIISVLMKNVFVSLFSAFYDLMSIFEFAEKMTGYYDNVNYSLDTYVSFGTQGPTTLLVLLYIYMSSKEDCKSLYYKCLIWGEALYNIGAYFPMMFRVVYPLLFIGIIFVPSCLNIRKSFIPKMIMFALLIFMTNAVNHNPLNQDDHLLPYNFIWQD